MIRSDQGKTREGEPFRSAEEESFQSGVENPTKEMLARGVKPEALSFVKRDDAEITIFLVNLFERYGKAPGEYREEFRKVLVTEFADWAGMELTRED